MIVPGDELPDDNWGPGVYLDPISPPVPIVCGELASSGKTTYVTSNSKRYVPAARDMVIGVISNKMMDAYRVTLQDKSKPIRLSAFAFEGANKKNRPNLVPGDVVYGRIASANLYCEPELECVDATTGRASGFGQLKDGYLVNVSCGYARHLLFKGHPLLDAIGKKYTFELAIGVNGVVWIKADDDKLTLKIAEWIRRGDGLTRDQAVKLVK